MSRFILNPNLPEGDVTEIICGDFNGELAAFYEKRNIRVLRTVENKVYDKSVSLHADLSVLYLGSGKIVIDKGQKELINKLKSENFQVIPSAKEVKGNYPDDCILNHTLFGRYIIGNSKIFDESLNDECLSREVIHTNQGYCKCSVLVVDEHSIITDDESIAFNARKKGVDCLLIRKGDIYLKGHGYGFIGGASGKISKNEILFFGNITMHRDYEKIEKYIRDKQMKIKYFDFPLTDFGGIIPVKENNY